MSHRFLWLLVTCAPLLGCGPVLEEDHGPREDAGVVGSVCGDGMCQSEESCLVCSLDCGACMPSDEEGPAGEDGGSGQPPPSCGDGTCNGGEGCESCQADCGACDWPSEWSAFESEIFRLVNDARTSGASCPSGPRPATHALVWNDELAEAARLHSLDMAEQGYFSHTSLDGRSPWDRIDDAGYTGQARGENIAAGSSSPQQAFNGWMSSLGHCLNIMSPNTSEIGVGYAFEEDSSWRHYWTQTFGTR